MARQSAFRFSDRKAAPTAPSLQRPTLFVASGADWSPEPYGELAAMAARIVDLRGDAGLRISTEPTPAYHPDVAPFRAHALYRVTEAGEEWFGAVALLGRSREALEAAVREAHRVAS